MTERVKKVRKKKAKAVRANALKPAATRVRKVKSKAIPKRVLATLNSAATKLNKALKQIEQA